MNRLAGTLRRALFGVALLAAIVSHDLREAASIASRFVVIERGVVTQVGSLADLCAAPGSQFVAELVADYDDDSTGAGIAER
jgi:molybdate transport system ATP-binding protein